MKKTEKICEIVNGDFSWTLKVDGEEINFNNSSSADYFEKHYKKLGYKVLRDKQTRER